MKDACLFQSIWVVDFKVDFGIEQFGVVVLEFLANVGFGETIDEALDEPLQLA